MREVHEGLEDQLVRHLFLLLPRDLPPSTPVVDDDGGIRGRESAGSCLRVCRNSRVLYRPVCRVLCRSGGEESLTTIDLRSTPSSL